MSRGAEERFDNGMFVIVPDVPESATEAELDAWSISDPKEYKIKILDPTSAKMMELYSASKGTWASLDGKRLEFRSSFRPRSRYLYFHYCCTILRKSWHQNDHWNTLKRELGNRVWATSGRYLSKAQILAFVEEVGHEVGPALLRGARDPNTVVSDIDLTALVAATDTIRASSEDPETNSSAALIDSEDEDSDSNHEDD